MTTQELINHQQWLIDNALQEKKYIEAAKETISVLKQQLFLEQLMSIDGVPGNSELLTRAVGPLVEYLKKYYNPNITAIVTPLHVELLSEKQILFFD